MNILAWLIIKNAAYNFKSWLWIRVVRYMTNFAYLLVIDIPENVSSAIILYKKTKYFA